MRLPRLGLEVSTDLGERERVRATCRALGRLELDVGPMMMRHRFPHAQLTSYS
ncbi:MAG: hypothetical protein QOG65_3008 [Actinomycetota bacterium]|jgi:hypothetical protein|nr:hypothetical protein [Actinomycetota bacterium]